MKTKKKLTKAQRRIAVLKDALKQLKLKNIMAVPGEVIENPEDIVKGCQHANDIDKMELKPILNNLFKNKGSRCNVCLRGGLLLSTVNKENKFSVGDLYHVNSGAFNEDSVTDKRLLSLFSKTQLLMMENAFEANESYVIWGSPEECPGINRSELSKKGNEISYKFGLKYKNDNKRLGAILRNAIRNGGIFKP